jgi:type II secretory pathway component PulF
MLYFSVVLVSLAAMLTFVSSHLSTSFARILDDYTIGMHPTSQILFGLLNTSGITLLWCLVVITAMGLLYIAAWCIGFTLPIPPGMGWLAIQSARSTIERALAFPAEQQRPLGTMMGILAKYYPIRSIRSKLRVARDEINNGSDWIGSLRSASLLGRADTAVMYAAQRAGDLSWALREMAESNERRFIYRLQALMQVGTVVMVVALGSLVFFTCLAIFLPIVDMIESQI